MLYFTHQRGADEQAQSEQSLAGNTRSLMALDRHSLANVGSFNYLEKVPAPSG